MGAGRIKPRTPADVLKAVYKRLQSARDVEPFDACREAVETAYFEGMMAAFDETERCCGKHSGAREAILQVRELVAKNRRDAAKGRFDKWPR